MTTDYLAANRAYWERGYPAENVESCVFRFYGRILVPDFKLSGEGGETAIDFGCGQGATVSFFDKKGFNAFGCDISAIDIEAGRMRRPHLSDKLAVVDSKPSRNRIYCVSSGVSLVTAIQSLYYLADDDFDDAIEKLRSSMVPGGVFFATMMGEQCREYYDNSEPVGNGLRRVQFKNERLDVRDYFMTFIRDEDHLKRKFSAFRPVHVGSYTMKLRDDEGNGFHWTFCGVNDR
jgi:SAM-dependent methyltransferase